jgi:hypothetical protein
MEANTRGDAAEAQRPTVIHMGSALAFILDSVRLFRQPVLTAHPYLPERDGVKTTVEIPDGLFREAKTAAASRGLSLKTFLTEALKEKLSGFRRSRRADWPAPPPKLAKGEMRRIQSTIDRECSRIDPEEWR